MPAPTTTADVVALIRKSQLLADDTLSSYLTTHADLNDAEQVIRQLQTDGLLTKFQAEQLLKGRHKGFLLGKYRLLDRIGMGGMGQVYLAEHCSMKRRVALKVLPPDRGDSKFARERFLREARAAAALEHPNLVRAYDVEMDGDVAFLVMEYIDGITLHDLVSRHGVLEPGRAVHCIWQIANGLQAVHHRSLVHRDIKPANLLMDRSGCVRILDLGLVRSELDDDALTRGEGAKIVGTADYIAPEQAINSSSVDGRADLYSLGCTAYYLLTKQPPFPGEKISQKLIAHQAYKPKPIRELNPTVSPEIAKIIDKLLAKKPEDRYQSAVEVMDALAPFARALPPSPEEFVKEGEDHETSISNVVSFGNISTTASSAGGSAIRFATMGPKSGLSLASNQPTSAVAQQETLPVKKSPLPNPVTTPRPTTRATQLPQPPRVVVDLPSPVEVIAPPPMVKPIANSTTMKANALFRKDTPTTEVVGSQNSAKWGLVLMAVGVLTLIAIGVLMAVKS